MPARWLLAGVAALALAGLDLAAARGRLRHLALPVLNDPSAAPVPGAPPPAPLDGCTAVERARVDGRVSALAEEADGTLWVGTFDRGVRRVGPGGVEVLPGLEGREAFVNALWLTPAGLWIGTQRGALLFRRDERLVTALPGAAVTGFADVGGATLAGTSRGLFRLDAAGGAAPVALRTAAGPVAPLRVSALAVAGEHLWLGTSAGAWAVARAALPGADGLPLPARFVPLVFGDPPASSGTVVALAALGPDALAGTDDAGLVRLDAAGGVAALRFAEGAFNLVSPGAMLADGGRALVGTQGGGLLVVSAAERGPRAARPAASAGLAVTALTRGAAGLLAGTDEGRVLTFSCHPDHGTLGIAPAPYRPPRAVPMAR